MSSRDAESGRKVASIYRRRVDKADKGMDRVSDMLPLVRSDLPKDSLRMRGVPLAAKDKEHPAKGSHIRGGVSYACRYLACPAGQRCNPSKRHTARVGRRVLGWSARLLQMEAANHISSRI